MPDILQALKESTKQYPKAAKNILNPASYSSVMNGAEMRGKSRKKAALKHLGNQLAMLVPPIPIIAGTVDKCKKEMASREQKAKIDKEAKYLETRGFSKLGAHDVAAYLVAAFTIESGKLSANDQLLWDKIRDELEG